MSTITRTETKNRKRTPEQAQSPGPKSGQARRPRKRSRSRWGAAGYGDGLASPRDRARVRERNAAERTRVEQMLANVPSPVDLRTTRRGLDPVSANLRWTPGDEDSTAAPRAGLRAVPSQGCPVCASSTVVTDQVMNGGAMRLSECLHCEYRWTERPGRNWSQLGETMTRRARPQIVGADRMGGDSRPA
jgi:hypothetical protein